MAEHWSLEGVYISRLRGDEVTGSEAQQWLMVRLEETEEPQGQN